MSDNRQTSMSAIRGRMVATSLAVAVVVGILLLVAGSGTLAVAGVAATALFSSLACAASLSNTIAGIRAGQKLVVGSLRLSEDLSDVDGEQDDLKAITAFNGIIIQTVENRRKE